MSYPLSNKMLAYTQTALLALMLLSQLLIFFYFRNASNMLLESQNKTTKAMSDYVDAATTRRVELSERLGNLEGKIDVIIQDLTKEKSPQE